MNNMQSAPKDKQLERQQRMSTYRKVVRWMWYLAGAGVVAVILLFVILSFSNLPDTKELEDPKSKLASEIYAANGEVLGRYFIENRVPVSYDSLSPYLVQALIATEDERYFQHAGIDAEALGRVFFKTALLRKRNFGGGSTITQQLAKLLFTGNPGSGFERVIQKLKEWIIAVRLERKYTKNEIIEMYLNKFDFLNTADGIKAASEVYFGKSPSELNTEEAAVLVGMLKNPSLFNPMSRSKRDTVLHRRMVVLKQMENNGFINTKAYDSLRQIPLDTLKFETKTHISGLAPYFRSELSKEVNRILSQEQYRKTDGSRYNIYRDGLKIYTTIDPAIQEHMEEVAVEHMRKLQRVFDRHWKGMDPWTYKDRETTDLEMDARARKMKRMMWESDRFRTLREHYLDGIIEDIQNNVVDARLREVDIERMLLEEEKEGTLARLVNINYISEDMAEDYKKIINSREYWIRLKDQWEKLNEAAERSFETPTRMRVFTFENDELEKDTLMTPWDSLIYHHHFLQIGSMAVDPLTGNVKGWVGGVNFKYFKFDHVTSRRQVGSTFKPFIYATAISHQSLSPCFKVYDLPQTIMPGDGNFQLLEEWTPSNADGKYTGEALTLKQGLAKSKNTVSVYLMKQLGDTEPVRNLVDNMGISKEAKYSNGRYLVPKTPSICLGATDLDVMEMTGAYTTFANNGIYNKPRFLLKIEDRDGRKIYEEEQDDRVALNEDHNYVMVEMLKYAAGGFGALQSEVGGKTGTTNDFVDGWFMGITPSLVVGTWVGGEDRWIRFRNLLYGQGAYMAKPFFKELLVRLEKDENAEYDPKARFHVPDGEIDIELDCSKYEGMQGQTEENEFGDLEEFYEDEFGDEDLLMKRDSSFLEDF